MCFVMRSFFVMAKVYQRHFLRKQLNTSNGVLTQYKIGETGLSTFKKT
jgi:hypothetical protein